MRERKTWRLGAGLVALVAVLYAGLLIAFPERRGDTVFYTLLDIAFIPISVLIFTLVVDRVMAQREKEALLHKLNMVIGAFFSEAGTELMDRLVTFDGDCERVRPHLLFDERWTATDFARARTAVTGHDKGVSLALGDADELRELLVEKRPFLLRLLENQTLLEHGEFTDMLWAVFHLTEELAARGDLESTPPADRRHVELDIARAYGRILAEWLRYLEHLKHQYPYLYSFAVRTNPFDPAARIEVSK